MAWGIAHSYTVPGSPTAAPQPRFQQVQSRLFFGADFVQKLRKKASGFDQKYPSKISQDLMRNMENMMINPDWLR